VFDDHAKDWEAVMTYFQKFTPPIWKIFTGNCLLLFCSLFYLIWWVDVFRPNASETSLVGMFCITAAFITGFAALVLMSFGIQSLSCSVKGVPVRYILIGCGALFVIMLLVTVLVFHRPMTSELIIIHIWTTLQLSAVTVLFNTGRFGTGRAVILVVLTGIATIIGLISYVLYYRLEGIASYRDGMIPLIVDAIVMAVFVGMLAVSKRSDKNE
jgi:hypothetical protein